MDAEGIGLILARASELRSKITNCIQKTSTDLNATKEDRDSEENPQFSGSNTVDTEADEKLFNIRDAFESLEAQLSSLQAPSHLTLDGQALQQQQFYEREAALAEIDYSRQKLLKKLKEYKGEDLEVIHEATAFASETVEDNNDLLLPPYPSQPSRCLVSDNGYISHFPSTRSFPQYGVTGGDPSNELRTNHQESERFKSESKSSFRLFINVATKTVLTLVGVVAVLSVAGFEPMLKKRETQFKVLDLFQQQGNEKKRPMIQCPPGKVLVVEDGKTRCLVKERVEIPFESVVTTPDVNYGCG